MLRDKILGTRHKENDPKWENANFLVSDTRKSVLDRRFLTTSPKQFLRRTKLYSYLIETFHECDRNKCNVIYLGILIHFLDHFVLFQVYKSSRMMNGNGLELYFMNSTEWLSTSYLRWFVKLLFGYTLLNWYSGTRRYILNLITC